MKEVSEVIKSYHAAKGLGLKAALATVVKVEGSSSGSQVPVCW